MIDLDATQAGIDRWNGLNTEDATAVVAELRAAREVVEAFCTYRDHRGDRPLGRLLDALAAYDKAMGGK